MRVVGIIATVMVVVVVLGVIATALLSMSDFRRYLHIRKM
ncbi:MAG: hypothetical protein NVSMB12_11680 [Acidimicrobiales bacterium]